MHQSTVAEALEVTDLTPVNFNSIGIAGNHHKKGNPELISNKKNQGNVVECAHFPQCGGCSMLSTPYQDQNAKKNRYLESVFSKLEIKVEPILASNPNLYYRHKVQLPVGLTCSGKMKKTAIGCFATNSHAVIDQQECFIQDKDCSVVAWSVREWADRNRIPVYNEVSGNGFLRYVIIRKGAATGEILLGLVTKGDRPDGSRRLATSLLDTINKKINSTSKVVGIIQNVNTRSTNVVLGTKEYVWWGRPYLKEMLGDLKFKVEMSTFFQVNPFQTPVLYNEVKKRIDNNSTVLDLYCGIASITQWVASKVKRIDGIEENPKSVEAAKVSIALNKLDNVKVYRGDAESIKNSLAKKTYDTVILDPPRKGIGVPLCKDLVNFGIEKIIYVSCNPISLAEDISQLSTVYKASSVQGVDMFPHTEHIECVVSLVRR